jgi:hypothetical protein
MDRLAEIIHMRDGLRAPGDLEVQLTPAIASNLFMGLFGDTGGFMHANTNAGFSGSPAS